MGNHKANNYKGFEVGAYCTAEEFENFNEKVYPKIKPILCEHFIYIKCPPVTYFDKYEGKNVTFTPANWFIFAEHSGRSKTGQRVKYIVPFYREVSKDAMTFHLARVIRFPLESNKYYGGFASYDPRWAIQFEPISAEMNASFVYKPPKKYNHETKDLIDYARRRLQKRLDFNKDKQVIKFENYYLYNGKLVDINNRLHDLNIDKWIPEAKILRQYKEHYVNKKII